MAKLNKKGALALTTDMDNMLGTLQRVAATIGNHGEVLGIPAKFASDFQRTAFELTKKADALADHIEKRAGVHPQSKQSDFDAEEIGEEVAGPKEGDGDESYMKGEFSQQENRELRERVEKSEMGPDKTTTAPQSPSPGIQASMKNLLRTLSAMDEDDMDEDEKKKAASALRLASEVLGKLAGDDEDEDDKDEDVEAKKKANSSLYA